MEQNRVSEQTHIYMVNSFSTTKKSFQQIVLEQMDIYKREKEPQNSNYPNIAQT